MIWVQVIIGFVLVVVGIFGLRYAKSLSNYTPTGPYAFKSKTTGKRGVIESASSMHGEKSGTKLVQLLLGVLPIILGVVLLIMGLMNYHLFN